MPTTKWGKWSVGLHLFFLTAVIVSILLVKVLTVLNFDDRWWDVTVAVIFPASLIALTLGLIAKRKHGDNSATVLLSIILGLGVILFIIFHSLFITD